MLRSLIMLPDPILKYRLSMAYIAAFCCALLAGCESKQTFMRGTAGRELSVAMQVNGGEAPTGASAANSLLGVESRRAAASRFVKPTEALSHSICCSSSALPIIFEANQGQTDPQVKFLVHGRAYTLFLTPTE